MAMSINPFRTIGSRIISTVVVLIVFIGIVGGVAFYGLSALTSGANSLIDDATDLVFVFRAQVKINQMVRAEKDFVLTQDQKFVDEHTALRADIQVDLEEAKDIVETDVERAKLEEILDAVDSYDAGFAEIKAAIEEGASGTTVRTVDEHAEGQEHKEGDEHNLATVSQESASATGLIKAEELTQSSSNVLAAEMNKIIGEIVEGRETVIEESGKSANAASRTVNIVEILALIIAIGVGVVIAFLLVRSTNKTLQDAINRLVAASNTVFGYTGQLTGEQEKLTSIVNQVSKGSASQSQAVEDNTKTMTDLQTSLGDTADNAKVAAEQTTSAAELATQGTEAGQEAVTRLTAIDDIVKKNTVIVQEVDERADEVASIVVTIADVADQINLLALNAAIEAARAGEQGRGFAVVADEVRKLAEQATTNVGKVDEVVKAVKERAATAVSNLKEGSEQITESTKIVNNALSILDQISTAAQEISARAQEISTTNTQQTASAEQLASALEQVASSAEQNTSGAQQATSAVTLVAELIQKTVKQSQDLTQLSKELQALVGAARAAEEAVEDEVEREERVKMEEAEEETELQVEREEVVKEQEDLSAQRRQLEKEARELEREKKEVAVAQEKSAKAAKVAATKTVTVESEDEETEEKTVEEDG